MTHATARPGQPGATLAQPATVAEPAADFSDALRVIRDYHAHLLALCDGLVQLVEQVGMQPPAGDFGLHARALQRALSSASARHHRDEELTLFPCVKYPPREDLQALLERLEADHVEIDLVWDWLAPLLQNTGCIDDHVQFSHVLRQYVQLVQRHIEAEEKHLLPVIERLLNPGQRARIGASMRRDRLACRAP